MPKNQVLNRIVLAAALFATVALAQTPYDEGQKALREQQWMEAVGQFDKVANAGGEKADAATYWMAYAYYKANRPREGRRELARLERKYPDSPWLKEAQALRLEYQDTSAEKVATGALEVDDEMKLFALMQLMERDPARTTPLVLEVAHSAESASTRRDALFLLAMSDEPAARAAVVDFARNSDNPKLQREAIQMLGTMEATSELRAIYPEQDDATKSAIIESLGVAGDTGMLRDLLETESDPKLRKAAIFGIAMHGETAAAEYAAELYRAADNPDEKLAVLESLMVMDDDDAIDLALDILRTESDPRLQTHAIHALGVMDATAELGDLYARFKDNKVKMAIIEALSISEDSESLVKILETETDRQLRSTAVQMLAVTESPEATKYLVEMYPGATRDEKKDIIHSMLILEDPDALVGLMKQESDPVLKREMLQMLVAMDSDDIDEELFQLLEKKQ